MTGTNTVPGTEQEQGLSPVDSNWRRVSQSSEGSLAWPGGLQFSANQSYATQLMEALSVGVPKRQNGTLFKDTLSRLTESG